mmetsp:Transcript_29798/g.67510  ORF Transcript_29798/g.67510 Transcript_29798/m.67510 type:complete len:188 (+) Transcript_29798:275-838(+)
MQRPRVSRAAAAAFLEAEPAACYNAIGQVCNKSELTYSGNDDEEQKLDERSRHLQRDWANSGLLRHGGLRDRVKAANAAAAAERMRLEARAEDYVKAKHSFEQTFAAFQKDAKVWRGAMSGLEDDYALYCRPFRDVTMPCEGKWRSAIRWWYAREPLPTCVVGVVTPYSRTPKPSVADAVLHWLFSS